MDRLYRFSPILAKDQLYEAIEYVANKTTELCKRITGNEYQINGLTIFSHYPNEFDKLKRIVLDLGTFYKEHNGPYVKLHQPIQLFKNSLSLLQIRQPDPYRFHVGCNDDFEVGDYQDFKRQFLNKNPNNLRLIERPEYEMIEFFDPDYDVLAYVVSD